MRKKSLSMGHRSLYLSFSLICLFTVRAQAQMEAHWLGELPQRVHESSGLLIMGQELLTHNDSGNAPELYFLDSVSLELRRTVRLANAVNVDWEAIAQDEEFVYIGDFGNNLGNRRDLKILKVAKSDLETSETVMAGSISFQYEDQSDFKGSQNSDWDAEALVATPDSLLIFTKRWQSQGTVVYAIPKTPGDYRAVRKGEIPVKGLITGASRFPDRDGLILCGYSLQLQPFILELENTPIESVWLGSAVQTQIPIAFAQVEGIAIGQNQKIYLTSEAFSNKLLTLPAGIYTLTGDPSADNDPQVLPNEFKN